MALTINGTDGIETNTDTGKLKVGIDDDLQIYHNGTNNYIDGNKNNIYIRNNVDGDDGGNIYIEAKSGETSIECADDGFVSLYYDGTKKWETTANGCQLTGQLDIPDGSGSDGANHIRIGNSFDFRIYHDGTDTYINNRTGKLRILSDDLRLENTAGDETLAKFANGGACELRYNDLAKLTTTSGGISVTGNVGASNDLEITTDSGKIKLGADSDLQIYHDGSHGYLKNTTGDFYFQGTTGENHIIMNPNAGVKLLYDDSVKFQTGSNPAIGMLGGDSVLNLNTNQDGNGSDYFIRGSKNSTEVGAGTDVFWIYEDGDMTNINGSFTQHSDIKLKENIVDAPSQWDDIKALKVRKFNFKSSTGYETHTQIGMVAQEVETVSPGLIKSRIDLKKTTDSDGVVTETDTGEEIKSIKLTVLYMKAVKALQEAMAKIETLETKVAALEAA